MDAYDRCTNLGGKKSCRYCWHLWWRPRTFQTTHVCLKYNRMLPYPLRTDVLFNAGHICPNTSK